METETLEAMLTTSDSQILLFIITIVFGLVALKLFSKLLSSCSRSFSEDFS